MNAKTSHRVLFERLQPRLTKIAIRALGASHDVQSVLDEAHRRWERCSNTASRPEASLLIIVTMRLVLELQRRDRPRLPSLAGDWLYKPWLSMSRQAAQYSPERADDVTVAVLALLERVSPQARAALLLRGGFSSNYQEVASLTGQSEPECRALVRQSKTELLAELAQS